MALHGNAAATIGNCFRALGNAYQIGNDILNFSGGDGANTSGSDLRRRAPNGVIVLFRATLDDQQRVDFDLWYANGSDDGFEIWLTAVLHSSALGDAAVRMNALMVRAEAYADTLPSELADVITPIQHLLQQVCVKSVASLNQA